MGRWLSRLINPLHENIFSFSPFLGTYQLIESCFLPNLIIKDYNIIIYHLKFLVSANNFPINNIPELTLSKKERRGTDFSS
jgi:hypothetical protein